MHFTVTAELESVEILESDKDFAFLEENATLRHWAFSEFLLHIGSDANERGSLYRHLLKKMTKEKCSKALIDAYKKAKESGAVRLLLYA